MNNPSPPPSRRVVLIGVNERTTQALDMLFSMQGKGQFQRAEPVSMGALSEASSNLSPQVSPQHPSQLPPQLAVVDLDGPAPEELWQAYRAQYPHLPTVVMSMQAKAWDGAVSLKKPVKPVDLLAALFEVSQSPSAFAATLNDAGVGKDEAAAIVASPLEPAVAAGEVENENENENEADDPPRPELVSYQGDLARPSRTRGVTSVLEDEDGVHPACGTNEDIDPRDQAQLRRVFYRPDGHFQSICEQAMTRAMETDAYQMLAVEGQPHPFVMLPQKPGWVVTYLPIQRLRFFCLVPLASTTCVIHEINGLAPDLNAAPRYTMDRMRWEVALWSSRGRLPEGTSLDIRVKLTRWPNFTRLTETPDAMRIAALWTEGAHTLLQTAHILAIPQRHVFAFYCATLAIGLIEVVDEDEAPGASGGERIRHGAHDRRSALDRRDQSREAVDRRGLFARILNHLIHRK